MWLLSIETQDEPSEPVAVSWDIGKLKDEAATLERKPLLWTEDRPLPGEVRRFSFSAKSSRAFSEYSIQQVKGL